MKLVFIFVLGLIFLLPLLAIADSGIKIAELTNGQKYIANQILITNEYDAPSYLTGQADAGFAITGVVSVDELCRQYGVVSVEPLFRGRLTKPTLLREISRIYIFTFTDDVDATSLLQVFADNPWIEFAELLYLPHLNYVPNDPRASDQWYLSFTQAYQAWDLVRGDTTKHAIIGIVDSGVHWDHPDLAANIWINLGEDINHNGIFDNGDLNGIDDDSNGFIDDVVGYDFGNNDSDPSDDAVPHGTAVAGCASEVADNSLLGAGIGFNARIMCLKGFNDTNGGTNLYQAFIYAADMGAQIINCSWASPFSQAGQNLMDAAWAEGALIIASAGGGSDTSRVYPAGYNHVMAVAATDNLDHRAPFSGYGPWVDICAPGADIWTTYGQSEFVNYSGTSFSAGLVSGLAALVCAWHPGYTNDQIENIIKISADTIPNNNGLLGAGRINCARAVNLILSGIEDIPKVPDQFTLCSNYPNPFNAQTTISYELAKRSYVSLDIYDLLGRKIGSLQNEYQDAGMHSVVWNAGDLSSGLYYYRLQVGDLSQVKRCTLIK